VRSHDHHDQFDVVTAMDDDGPAALSGVRETIGINEA